MYAAAAEVSGVGEFAAGCLAAGVDSSWRAAGSAAATSRAFQPATDAQQIASTANAATPIETRSRTYHLAGPGRAADIGQIQADLIVTGNAHPALATSL
jgi:hypothetical protein